MLIKNSEQECINREIMIMWKVWNLVILTCEVDNQFIFGKHVLIQRRLCFYEQSEFHSKALGLFMLYQKLFVKHTFCIRKISETIVKFIFMMYFFQYMVHICLCNNFPEVVNIDFVVSNFLLMNFYPK